LFRPQTATRVRWNLNTDTPLPPDFPAGENPPDGAVINYFLTSETSGVVTLEIRDEGGQLVRRYSSADPVPPADPMLAIPAYWLRPPQVLSAKPGAHRFLWDLHYEPVPGVRPSYPIAAIFQDTAPEDTSPWVLPGRYTVILTANGRSVQQTLTVRMDPRVKTVPEDLLAQFKLSYELYDQWRSLAAANEKGSALLKQLTEPEGVARKELVAPLTVKLRALLGAAEGRRPEPGVVTIANATARTRTLFNMLQEADVAPTTQVRQAIADLRKDKQLLDERWNDLRTVDLASLNKQLAAAGLPQIEMK
jgi:hypothetical protein